MSPFRCLRPLASRVVRASRAVVAIVLAGGIVACGGGGDAGPPGAPAPLPAGEQASMASALARVFARASPTTFSLGPGLTLRSTVACPNGGSTTSTGTYQIDASPPRIRISAAESMDRCRAPGDDGTIWTFDTDQPTTMTIDWRSSSTTETLAITLFGDVDVTDGAGRPVPQCDVDLDIDAQFLADGRVSLRMRGLLCGVPTDVFLPAV